MDFHRRERSHLILSSPSSISLILLSLSPLSLCRVLIKDLRNGVVTGGCIVSVQEPSPERSKSLHIVLDEPINSSPTSQEIVLSREYHLIENYFLVLDRDQRSFMIAHDPNKKMTRSLSPNAYLICTCERVSLKSSFFVCSCGYYQCWKHFLPWDEKSNGPDVQTISEFAEYLLTNFPDATFISTRALLYYSQWSKAQTYQDRFNVGLTSLQDDCIRCGICGLDASIRQVHYDLFPNEKINDLQSNITADTTLYSHVTLIPRDIINIHLVDRDKYRYEETMSQSIESIGDFPPSDGSVYAHPSIIFPECEVAIDREWSNQEIRATLLNALFHDSNDNSNLKVVPFQSLENPEWEDYSIYLVENDLDSTHEFDKYPSKWITHKLSYEANENRLQDSINQESGHFDVHQLKDGDVLTIRSNRDNVGPLARISVLGAEYSGNVNLQYKTKELSFFYSGWRKIRGDGNCYFRAVIYGYIEYIIATTFEGMTSCVSINEDSHERRRIATQARKEAFGQLLQILEVVSQCYHYDHEIDAHKRLLWTVKRAIDGEKWISLTEFENDILNSYTRMDQSLVRAIRYAAGEFIIRHQGDNHNGISLRDAILPSYPSCRTLNDYVEDYVMRMGIDAEGPLVDLGILFSLLSSEGSLAMFDRRDEIELSIKTFPCHSRMPLAKIHLLYRPGHYDLLYPLSISTKFKEHTTILSEETANFKSSPTPSSCHAVEPHIVVTVASLFPPLQEFGMLILQDLTTEESDFILIEPETPKKDSLFVIKQLTLEKYPGQIPSLQEQATRLSRIEFKIPDDRSFELHSVQSTQEDYIPSNVQMIAMVSNTSKCQVSIVGIQKSSGFYLPITQLNRIWIKTEIMLAIDWTILSKSNELPYNDDIQTIDRIDCDSFFSTLLSRLNINRLLYSLAFSREIRFDEYRNLLTLSLELCVTINFKICGVSQSDISMPIPITAFSSTELFIDTVHKKLGLNPTTCLQLSAWSEKKLFQTSEEIFRICSNGMVREPPLLLVKYCEVSEAGTACETISSSIFSDDDVCSVTMCGHLVCKLCLLRHLVLYSNDRAFEEDYHLWDSTSFASSPNPKVLLSHLFEPMNADDSHDAGDVILPVLRKIPCPVKNCTACLSEMDLNVLPEYHHAYSDAISNIFSRRTCSLFSILNCDSRPIDLHKMVCLGCSHFYHPECFLHYITAEIQNFNLTNEHIVCIQCRMSNNACNCLECNDRLDKTPTGEHIINENDMKSFQHLIRNLRLPNVSPKEKSQIEADINNLVGKWSELYLQRSIKSVSKKNGRELFECECGQKYEIESKTFNQSSGEETKHPGLSTTFSCPNRSCRAVYCAQCLTKTHPSLTCQEASIERTLGLIRAVSIGEDIPTQRPTTLSYLGGLALSFLWGTTAQLPSQKGRQTGINIQHCPNCDAAYSAPINCFHVVCEKNLGGCGLEFCFICAAPRSPILAHGNMMHRATCPFNIDRFCCEQKCLIRGLGQCADLQWSEHCSECAKHHDRTPCSFPSSTNSPISGKHWKVLDLSDIRTELSIIQGNRDIER